MSILNGIGIAIFPLAEFLSGQIFQVNWILNHVFKMYLKMYLFKGWRILCRLWLFPGVHIFGPHLHLLYPRDHYKVKVNWFFFCSYFIISLDFRRKVEFSTTSDESHFSFKKMVKKANQSIIEGFQCMIRKRPHRKILLFALFLMIFSHMTHASSSTLLYVEKKFHWTVTDYTNYSRYEFLFLKER